MCAINKSQSKTDFYMQLAMLRRFSLPVMWAMRHWRIKKNTTTTTSMVAKVERTAGRQLKNCRQILARSLREFEPGFHRHTCRAYPESHSNWLTTIVFSFPILFSFLFDLCEHFFEALLPPPSVVLARSPPHMLACLIVICVWKFILKKPNLDSLFPQSTLFYSTQKNNFICFS